jgi:hypothetical protein
MASNWEKQADTLQQQILALQRRIGRLSSVAATHRPSDTGDTVPVVIDGHAITHENGGVDEIDVTGLSGLLADPQLAFASEILTADPAAPNNDTFWMRRDALSASTLVEIRGRIAGFTYTLFSTNVVVSEDMPNITAQMPSAELLRYSTVQNAWRYRNRVALPILGPLTDTRWQMPPREQPNKLRYEALRTSGRYRANKTPLVFIPGPTVDTRFQPAPRTQPSQQQYALRANLWRYVNRKIFVP